MLEKLDGAPTEAGWYWFRGVYARPGKTSMHLNRPVAVLEGIDVDKFWVVEIDKSFEDVRHWFKGTWWRIPEPEGE